MHIFPIDSAAAASATISTAAATTTSASAMPAACRAGGQATALPSGVAPAAAAPPPALSKRKSRSKEGSGEERKLILELAKGIFPEFPIAGSSLGDASSLASLSRLGSPAAGCHIREI